MPVLHILPGAGAVDMYTNRVQVHNKSGGENSGFDLVIPTDVVIQPSALPTLVDSGICSEMIEDDGSSGGYMLVPRSSICKVAIRQHNGVGIIDPGYRGPIKIPITSIDRLPIKVDKGARYFQLVHPSLKPFKVKIVTQLSKSMRGEGGFGSTGNEGGVTVQTK
jgi:deoxyuridine 5'-triphosphate nucleotidohydrolase